MSQTNPPVASTDPFLLAWGEVGAWRGVSAQAALVSVLPQSLVEWNTAGIFKVAHAIGQSQALRHHLVEEVDTLVSTLGVPYLHRGMDDLRSGRNGWLRKWRRFCIRRALSLCNLVFEEGQQLAVARVKLEAWVRALDNATEGLHQQRDWIERTDSLPGEYQREWSELRLLLLSSVENVELLRTHFVKLLEGVECLRMKAALFDEVCNAVPNHEDILLSVSFSTLLAQLVALPCSSIPVSRE